MHGWVISHSWTSTLLGRSQLLTPQRCTDCHRLPPIIFCTQDLKGFRPKSIDSLENLMMTPPNLAKLFLSHYRSMIRRTQLKRWRFWVLFPSENKLETRFPGFPCSRFKMIQTSWGRSLPRRPPPRRSRTRRSAATPKPRPRQARPPADRDFDRHHGGTAPRSCSGDGKLGFSWFRLEKDLEIMSFSVDDRMIKIFEDVGMRILDPQSGFCTKHVVGEWELYYYMNI